MRGLPGTTQGTNPREGAERLRREGKGFLMAKSIRRLLSRLFPPRLRRLRVKDRFDLWVILEHVERQARTRPWIERSDITARVREI